MSTHTIQPEQVSVTPQRRRRHGLMKLLVFLVSLALSAAGFLAFDWMYSTATGRASKGVLKPNLCRVADRTRHHALKPNCSSTIGWGRNTFEFFTNSLGFRDERVREVPLAEARPRILLLGDSFTEGELGWGDTYVGKIAGHFPQYDVLNGGVTAYSASNYLNVTRMVLAAGYQIDEVIVFIDLADVHFEAAFYRDVNVSGAVAGPEKVRFVPLDSGLIARLGRHLLATNDIIEFFRRQLVGRGYYNAVNATDAANWTYGKVSDSDPFPVGYAPLGLEGGLAKEEAKMNLLWQELEKRHIPLSVVVYPYPGQIIHDTADSLHVRIWRKWCEGKCTRFITAFPEFLAAKRECPRLQPGCWYQKLFIFGDFHYNAAGNALVADAVIQSLTEKPPLKHVP